jgi:ubiquitin-like protein Nedd8
VWPFATAQILNLKTMLQEKEGIDVKQIRLIHNGRQLADDKTLEACGVIAGTTLHMVLALRGGR